VDVAARFGHHLKREVCKCVADECTSGVSDARASAEVDATNVALATKCTTLHTFQILLY